MHTYDTSITVFSKALAAKLNAPCDLESLKTSKPAFKAFVTLYDQFARAAGLGPLKLNWFLEKDGDGDLILKFSGPERVAHITFQVANRNHIDGYWFDNEGTGVAYGSHVTCYGDLFEHSFDAVFDYPLNVSASRCDNILSEEPSVLNGLVLRGFGHFKDEQSKHRKRAAYDAIADAVRDHGQKKIEAQIREIDKNVSLIRNYGRN